MLKFICTILIGLCLLFKDSYATVNPKDIITPSTKLVYDVYDNGNYYELIMRIKKSENNTTSIEWKMNEPAKEKGSIHLTKNDLENGNGFYKFFTEKIAVLNNQNCVLLSTNMFDQLKNNSETTLFIDNKKNTTANFGNLYYHTQNFGLGNNFNNEFNCATVTNGYYQITFVNDRDFPLIMDLKLDYTIKLKKILP